MRGRAGRIALRRFLARGVMSHDRAGPIPGAPPLPGEASPAEGIARLRAAIASFRAHAGVFHPHLAFGALTRDEYERVHAMHVADHLSNLV